MKDDGAENAAVRQQEGKTMSDKLYDIPTDWLGRAYVKDSDYRAMYERSIKDPNGFWANEAKRIHWYKPPSKIKNTTFDPHNVSIKWFEDGVTNIAYNCIDRHLAKRANQTAIIWEGDDPSQSKHITYRELHDEVCKFANILRNRNVEKGDRVTIYLPMIPEAAYAMLACARIGAIHSVVFGGFSPDSLMGSIQDCDSNVLITADEGLPAGSDERRGPAVHPLHVRLDRQAEGRTAHDGRLSRLRRDDASIRLRLSR